jgi:hypothetical protein
MEWRLADAGYVPTAIDSEALWIKQRQRASDLGPRALVLLGASRIQLGVDLATLRRRTRFEPVQLAIDGSGFLPILDGLASDPSITGIVLIDYHVDAEPSTPLVDAADVHQRHFEESRVASGLPDFAWAEAHLGDFVHSRLRSYADGAQPITSFLMRILPSGEAPQYLVTLPDRSRVADYSMAAMPRQYLLRVARELALPTPPEDADMAALEAELRGKVMALKPASADYNERRYARILAATQRIEARGGRVMFIVMPTSKLVRDLEDRRYPRTKFFEPFAARVAPRATHWLDSDLLRRYTCPDGSHLDKRDRVAFTNDLVTVLGLDSAKRNGAPSTSPPAATPADRAATARSP